MVETAGKLMGELRDKVSTVHNNSFLIQFPHDEINFTTKTKLHCGNTVLLY